MTLGARPPGVPVEFEVFSTALGLAIVAGALSLLAPFLLALVGTLGTFAVAGWAALVRPRAERPSRVRRTDRLLALGVAAIGGILFLHPPAGLGAGRGLLLAASLLPLWCVERRRPRPVSGGGRP